MLDENFFCLPYLLENRKISFFRGLVSGIFASQKVDRKLLKFILTYFLARISTFGGSGGDNVWEIASQGIGRKFLKFSKKYFLNKGSFN